MSSCTIYINAENLRAKMRRGEEPPWYEWVGCGRCHGVGTLPLFMSVTECDECGGTKGKWVTTSLLPEMLGTPEGRDAYRAYQKERHLRTRVLQARIPGPSRHSSASVW